MPRPTIDNIRSVGDFATLFRWNLTFVQLPAGIAGTSSEDLNLRCESAEIPKLTDQTIEVSIRGNKVRQPGIHNYSNTITFNFAETVDSKVTEFIRQWRELCWQSQTGVTQPKGATEAVILIQRLNNQDQPIYQYKLVGCFLEDYDAGGTLDGASSDILKPSMILSYDYFIDEKIS